MTGSEILGGGLAGVIVGAVYLVAKVVERRADRRNGSGPISKDDINLMVNTLREGMDKMHDHLRQHEDREMTVFESLRTFMEKQTEAQTRICTKLEEINRRTLEAEIREKIKREREGGVGK